jgi:putative ABC transport system ATP-binding protein
MSQLAVAPGGEASIVSRRVSRVFRTARGDVAVLRDIDLRVACGEYVAVVGKSGSGKSTLLNMLAAIDTPTSGEVMVGGVALKGLSERASASWRGRHVGIVFQFFQLLPGLSVVENVMLPMDFCNTFPGRRKERALALLDRVGLADHARKPPTALSGGEQQRVAVARALANDPQVILADEPTGNLDSETSVSVDALLGSLAAEGKTVLVVTHTAVDRLPYSRVVTLADGAIVADRLGGRQASLEEVGVAR